MPEERLQKVLASRGVLSRRKAEELIAAGVVRVNGEVAHLGQVVSTERDAISVSGVPLAAEQTHVYIALNKPSGWVTTLRSTHGERTVADLIDLPEHLFPVGRLDKDTSGLLFLTNDGDWANLVTHPRYLVEKEYEAIVAGTPDAADLRRLRDGMTLPGGQQTAPAAVELLGKVREESRLSVTVIEGKKRQIRLMCAAVGHPVRQLRRVRVGTVQLGGLAAGRWRFLLTEEVESMRAHARRTAKSGRSNEAAGRDRWPRGSRQVDRRTGPGERPRLSLP